MDPKQVALQNKPELESKGFVVDAQGNVTYPPNGGGFFPPWVWSQSLSSAPMSWKIPGSDPSSAWASMYQGGGPFTNHSQWDSNNATYDSSTDWGTLLGTIAAGSLIGGGAAAAFGGGGAAGGGTAAASEGVPFTTSGAGSVGGVSLGSGAAGAGSALSAATAGASASAPWVKAIAGLASVLGGHAIGNAAQSGAVPSQLNDLLNMSVQRQQQQQPLGQAVDQGIYQMLPNFARTGTSMPNVPTNAAGGLTAFLGGK